MGSALDRFMVQQGFHDEETALRRWHFRALLLQPSVVGLSLLAAIVLQSQIIFFVLAAVLVWSAVLPRLNPFERFYDWVMGGRGSSPRLEPAPAPRRFAQSLAATFMAVTGLSLAFGWLAVAYVFEAFLVVAFTALIAGKFCLGAYLYHTLCGRRDFANATCPWSK